MHLNDDQPRSLRRQLTSLFPALGLPELAFAAGQPSINILRMAAPVAEPVSRDTSDSGSTDIDNPTQQKHSQGTHGVRRRRRHNPIKRAVKKITRVVKWQFVLVTLLIIVIIPTAAVMAITTDASVRVRESLVSLKRVVTSLDGHSLAQYSSDDFHRLQFAVDDFGKTLTYARQRTGFLRRLQSLRPEIGTTLDALDAAQEVAIAGQDILKGLEPSMFFILQGDKDKGTVSQLTVGERLVELLRIGQGSFLNADQHLSTAQDIIHGLDMTDLSPDLLLSAQELIKYHGQLQDIDKILLDAPDLFTKAFGLNDPQDYLVLSANSDEIRPSGGYISTFGWMRIRRIHVIDYGYGPTNSTSPIAPPEEMFSQLKVPSWWMGWMRYNQPVRLAWDGSWSPDFPATAQRAAWFYDNGNNPRSPVGGVIGIDLVGFEYILAGLGPVTIAEYGETVTADNFRQVIYKIREAGGFEEPHKRFLAAVYKQILGAVQNATQQNNQALLVAVLRALREKHIMLYFKDEKLNQVANMLGWSGAQLPGRTNDYILVADTNMSGKTNRSVIRQLTYDVQIQDNGSLQSRLSVSYDFPATVAAKDPAFNPKNYSNINYFNGMQVYVPANSTLTEAKNNQTVVTTDSDSDHTIFASMTETEYDSTERFQFLYTTPPLIENFGPYHRYRLLLQKQAGMSGEAVSIQVTLPANAKVVSASLQPVASYNLGQPILEFRTQLAEDQWIEIIYQEK